jgi:hypothetical protein
MEKTGWSMKVERELDASPINDTASTAFLAFFKDRQGVMVNAYPSDFNNKTQIVLFVGDTG